MPDFSQVCVSVNRAPKLPVDFDPKPVLPRLRRRYYLVQLSLFPERKPEMTSSTARVAARKPAKLSRMSAPTDLSPIEWQRGLLRQFGREQSFLLENLGADPFFSEFRVANPGFEIELSRGGARPRARRQFLLVPGLCDQRARHLQASQVYACPTGKEARRQSGVRARLPAATFRTLSAQPGTTQHPFPRRNRLPSEREEGSRPPVRSGARRHSGRRSSGRSRRFRRLGVEERT